MHCQTIIMCFPCSFSLFTVPLGTCEMARPVNAGSHYLYYNLNDLNVLIPFAEKNFSRKNFSRYKVKPPFIT